MSFPYNTRLFARGPYVRPYSNPRSPDWVGFELESLPAVPQGFERTVKNASIVSVPNTRKTIAPDDTTWRGVVSLFDTTCREIILATRHMEYLSIAERAEMSAMTVKSPIGLGSLAPEEPKDELPPPGMSVTDWQERLADPSVRYATKSGFYVPLTMEPLVEALIAEVESFKSDELTRDLSRARTDTNSGFPFMTQEGHTAQAAIAVLARSHAELVALQAYFWRVLNGYDPPPGLLVSGERIQETTRVQDLLLRSDDGAVVSAGQMYGAARSRNIYMGDRARADLTRLGSRYGLKAIKRLYRQCDHTTPAATRDDIDSRLGDDTEMGDASRFDSTQTSDTLPFSMALVAGIQRMFDSRDELIRGVCNDLISMAVMVPSSVVPGVAALRPLMGLPSGIAPTSTVANFVQSAVMSEAWYRTSIGKLTKSEARVIVNDPSFRESIPSVWYGDDVLIKADVVCEDRSWRSELDALYASMGMDYDFEKGRTFLRMVDGNRLATRKWWRSVDAERTRSSLIADIGTVARWITPDDVDEPAYHKRSWNRLMEARSLCGLSVYDTPEKMLRAVVAEVEKTQTGKRTLDVWLEDQRYSAWYDWYRFLFRNSPVRTLEADSLLTRSAARSAVLLELRRLTGDDHSKQLNELIASFDSKVTNG